jgi:hypothetical protein
MVTGVALVQQHELVPGGRSALVPDRQNLSGCSNTHGVAKAGETDRLTLDTDKSSPDKRAFSRPSSRVRTGKDRRMECNVCPTEPVLPGPNQTSIIKDVEVSEGTTVSPTSTPRVIGIICCQRSGISIFCCFPRLGKRDSWESILETLTGSCQPLSLSWLPPQITPTARSPAAPGLVRRLPATRRKRRGLSGRKPHGLRLRCANGCRRDGPVGQCYGCY